VPRGGEAKGVKSLQKVKARASEPGKLRIEKIRQQKLWEVKGTPAGGKGMKYAKVGKLLKKMLSGAAEKGRGSAGRLPARRFEICRLSKKK